MARVGIVIRDKGLDRLISDLKRFEREGIPRAMAALDEALEAAGAVSRDLAHQHTGTMAATQRLESEHGTDEWRGEVIYEARGAIFEMQRGGDHAAFIDQIEPLTMEQFEQAMDRAFDVFRD